MAQSKYIAEQLSKLQKDRPISRSLSVRLPLAVHDRIAALVTKHGISAAKFAKLAVENELSHWEAEG